MKKILCFALLLGTLFFSSCLDARMERYYSDKDNFVIASGTVDSVEYSGETDAIFISFTDLTPAFADNLFSVASESGKILRSKRIENKLHPGDRVEFVSAVAYFGDGYVMPIVSLTIDGEELLSFEEGYANFMDTF